MNAKLITGLLVLTAAGCSSVVWATDVNAPWARWVAAESAVTYDTGTVKRWTCADATGNGHNLRSGTYVFPSTVAAGRADAFYYDGWGPTWSVFTPAVMPSRTFAAWVWLTSGNLNHYGSGTTNLIYLLHGFSGVSVSFRKNSFNSLERTPPVLTLTVGENAFAIEEGAGRLLVKKWNHVAVTVDDRGSDGGTGRLADVRLYVNGVCVFSEDGVSAPTATAGVVGVGNANEMEGDYCPNSFIGYLSDIRIYDAALSASEVGTLYADTNDQPWLAGHWRMDSVEADSQDRRYVPDASGNTNNLYIGSLNFLTNGIAGPALFFDGAKNAASDAPASDSYASFTNSALPYGGEFTLAMWVKKASDQLTSDGGVLFQPSTYKKITLYDSYSETRAIVNLVNSSPNSATMPVLLRGEEWTHTVFTCRYVAGDYTSSDPALAGSQLKGYRNGALVFTGDLSSITKSCCEQYAFGLANSDGTPTGICFGNARINKNRPFRGTIDDLRLYACALSDAQVAALYRLPTEISAGEDFSVASGTAELHGRVSTRSETGIAAGVTGDLAWTLVSAPNGAADGVVIDNPSAAATSVSLPAEGSYVFRLESKSNGISSAAEVTVTRVASASGSTPTVVCSAAACGLSATVKAAASAGARVAWTKVSGPGAAWFVDDTAAETLVTFSVAGTYVLKASASNDAGGTSDEVAVTVAGSELSALVDSGLTAHWPMTNDTSRVGQNAYTDTVGGATLTPSYSYPTSHWYPSINGNYVWSIGDKAGTTRWATTYMMEQNNGVGYAPSNEWETVSLWMYHDAGCTNRVNYVCILNCYLSHALMYMPEGGASTDFEIMQIPSGSGKVDTMRCRYAGPAKNFTNRWAHVLVEFNCHATADTEVWVDGEKLSPRAGYSALLQTMRRVDSKYMFGGTADVTAPRYLADTNDTNRAFPGALSDIRIYNRRLDEAEVRYLAACPRGDENRAPDVSLGAQTLRTTVNAEVSVPTSVIDDGLPAGGTLKTSWEVVSGDASKLVVDDSNPTQTKITGLAGSAGGYVLRMVAADGDRTVYSSLLTLTIYPKGLLVIFK